MWLSLASSGFLSSKEGIPERKLLKSRFSKFSDFRRFLRILANFDFSKQAPDVKRKTGRSGAHKPDCFCEISKFFSARTGHNFLLGKEKRSTFSVFLLVFGILNSIWTWFSSTHTTFFQQKADLLPNRTANSPKSSEIRHEPKKAIRQQVQKDCLEPKPQLALASLFLILSRSDTLIALLSLPEPPLPFPDSSPPLEPISFGHPQTT